MFRLGRSTRINQAPPLHRELAQKKKLTTHPKCLLFVGEKTKPSLEKQQATREQKILPCSALRVAQQREYVVIFVRGIRWWLWRVENRKHRKEAENPNYTLDERTCRHCQGLRPETAEDVGLPEVNNWEKGLSRCHSKFPHSASVEGITCGGTYMVTRESASFLVPLIIWLCQSP